MTLIGSRVATWRSPIWREFQSLFSWMTLIGELAAGEQVEADLVSILVFLDDAHRLLDAWPRHFSPKRFQSLFSWMTLIGHPPTTRTAPAVLVFQSLFSWMTLIGSLSMSNIDPRGSSFNPCFLG